MAKAREGWPLSKKHHSLAVHMAGKYCKARRIRGWEVPDYVSAAFAGLMDAEDKYDPDGGAKFTTYAYSRIAFALIDHERCKSIRAKRYPTEKLEWVESTGPDDGYVKLLETLPSNHADPADAFDARDWIDFASKKIGGSDGLTLLVLAGEEDGPRPSYYMAGKAIQRAREFAADLAATA